MDYRISNYKLIRRLGAGAFGEVFQGVNPKTNQDVAIKFEKLDCKLPQVAFEAKLYQYLHTDAGTADIGVPRVHHIGTEGDHNVLVMDLLGANLEDLFNVCSRKLSLKTVLMLGVQMISRVEFLHSKFILHRDIKPDNFLMGVGANKHKLFVIDFGLAKRYVDKSGVHIPFREGKSMNGTVRYASVNMHLGIEQTRRDDLESIGYVLLYLLKGSLPWQNVKASNRDEKYNKIRDIKQGTSIETLCKGCPDEFIAYIRYCRSLKFEEKPDYSYLKNLLRDLFAKSEYECDYVYDWSAISRKKKEKNSNT